MRVANQANKEEGFLNKKFIERLVEAERALHLASRKSYIPFPVVWEKACRAFSIKKCEAWIVLKELQVKGRLVIIAYRGIRLLK